MLLNYCKHKLKYILYVYIIFILTVSYIYCTYIFCNSTTGIVVENQAQELTPLTPKKKLIIPSSNNIKKQTTAGQQNAEDAIVVPIQGQVQNQLQEGVALNSQQAEKPTNSKNEPVFIMDENNLWTEDEEKVG